MTMDFGYTLSSDGIPISFGIEGEFDNYINGSEPFSTIDIINWQWNNEKKEWIYNPQIMVPQTISKLQCVKRLLDTNRYNNLISALNTDTTGVSRILFDAAASLSRDSNMVNQLAAALGFSDEDTDAFFVEAEKIMV